MPLDVIGAGMPRTGTESLSRALELLGFARCYHMNVVIAEPAHLAFWESAAEATMADFEDVFTGFRAAVDFPAMFHWRRLVDAYAQAKVILSVRDAAAWYESLAATILSAVKVIPEHDPATARRRRLVRRDLLGGLFEGRSADRAFMLERFARHTRAVVDYVDARRLLVFDVAEGWAPLCRFLEVAVPDTPFPRGNATAEFRAKYVSENQP